MFFNCDVCGAATLTNKNLELRDDTCECGAELEVDDFLAVERNRGSVYSGDRYGGNLITEQLGEIANLCKKCSLSYKIEIKRKED